MKVLIVDDSATFRGLLRSVFKELPGVELVGHACNGVEALEAIERTRPDLVTLDLEMPELDGLGVLQVLQARGRQQAQILVLSSRTRSGAAATVQALELGAYDFLPKPDFAGFNENFEAMREGLAARIACLSRTAAPAGATEPDAPAEPVAPTPLTTRTRRSETHPARAVVIAVSTGGPSALREVVGNLPADLQQPVFIVQHMPPTFTRSLAESLDELSPLSVCEATDGEEVRPGTVYIAPGDRHLLVTRASLGESLELSEAAPESGHRPSADVLFRSAARVYGGDVLALVLTGMGSDGLAGATTLHGLGATVLAQDEASSTVYGMPRCVVQAGLADEVLPLDRIAARVHTYCSGSVACS